MQCPARNNKTFICPCRIKGTSLVLVWVLKTRCNKPNFDCLVYDMDADEARVVRQAEKWQVMFECDPALQDYDVDRMNRCAILFFATTFFSLTRSNSATQDWMILGRWEYEPKRGLRLDTRKPQLSDTELKALGYGEADTGFEVSSSEGMLAA